MFSESIMLRKSSITQDSYGGQVETFTDKSVFANRKSALRSEFYSASLSGHTIKDVFEVHIEDYDDQTDVIYKSNHYKVVRSYRKGDGVVELNCEVYEVLNTITYSLSSGGNPVEGAVVTLDGVSKTTGANGQAVFYSVPNGVSQYTITKTGLTTVSASLTVTADATVNVTMTAVVVP